MCKELINVICVAHDAAREKWSDRKIAQELGPLPQWVAARWDILDAATAGGWKGDARRRVRKALQELMNTRRMTAQVARRVGLYKFREPWRPRGGVQYQRALDLALREERDRRRWGRRWSAPKVEVEALRKGVSAIYVYKARGDAQSWANDRDEAIDLRTP